MAVKKCASQKAAVIMLVISVILFITSVVILIMFPVLFKTLLHQKLELLNNTMEFDLWKDLPIPIYERLYFFNITNKDEFLSNKEKLKVAEVGPYTYSAEWKKHNIRWHPNKTVTYQELRTYFFKPELSAGTEDDIIYTLNGPMAIAADFLKDQWMPVKLAASAFFGMEGETIIIQRSIRELVYEGYYDPIIYDGSYVLPGLPFKDGMFSWLYGKNATYDGQFTVFTGESDIKKLNTINNWNGNENVTFWKNDTCNMINGTTVEVNAPLDDDQKELSFFQSFFCRSLTFEHRETEASHYGLNAKRFVATEKIFANGEDNPDNKCFDIKPNLRSGLLDLSTCQFGAPVFISFPHYFMADPSYADAIIGLNNTNRDFLSYVDVEPLTGASLYAKLSFQLNIELSKIPYLIQFDKIQAGFYPILWAEIEVSVTEELAHLLKTRLLIPKIVTYTIIGIGMLVALIMFLTGVAILIRLRINSREYSADSDRTQIINSTDDHEVRKSGRTPEPPSYQFPQ